MLFIIKTHIDSVWHPKLGKKQNVKFPKIGLAPHFFLVKKDSLPDFRDGYPGGLKVVIRLGENMGG